MLQRRPWREELDIVDRTMKAISGVTDPDELVGIYWNSIGELIPVVEYVALSRRGVRPPEFLITRSSRFTEHFNPWTQRDRLPKLSGGILGELAYANKPVFIDDLPARLREDDPGYFYLREFAGLVALPQYDGGEGLNVIVMCRPHGIEPTPEMVPIMHWQAGLFGRGTTNLVLRNQLARALDTLDRELQAVGEIQRSLLPDSLPDIPGYDLAALYQTSARAGGDYYDFFPLDGGGWGMFIADVSGHGTPAAVFMAITHAIAHARPGTHTPPAALLDYLNDTLARAYTRGGTFVTAFYAVLDPATGSLTYSLAGHNPPRLVRAGLDGGAVPLDRLGGLPLGIEPDQSYQQATETLRPGDLLLLYTDGITETMAPRSASNPQSPRDMFGVERLDRLLIDGHGGTPAGIAAADCVDRIRADVATFAGHAPPTDDQTLIAIRRK